VLHEYELPGFLAPLRAGVAAGVMPAYNLVDGVPNHVHPLLRTVLRAAAPDLVICSDAQAPSNLVETEHHFTDHAESHAAALHAGVDSYTDNGPDPGPTIARFTEALDRGLITVSDIDAAVGRLLRLRALAGEFSPSRDPYTDIDGDVIACDGHARLAARAAHAGVVLLKNSPGALPWASPAGVAVIGHLGDRVLTDWYSGTLPYAVTIASALSAASSPDGLDRVRLSTSDGRALGADGRLGDGTVFAHQDWGTSVQCPVPVHTFRSDTGGYLTVDDDGRLGSDAATPDGWVVRELWELHPAGPDSFLLWSNALGAYVSEGPGGRLVAGAADGALRFTRSLVSSGVDTAVAAARAADRVVVVLGNDPHINGRETVDRSTLALPAQQEALLRAVAAANPATVLVLVSSYPYAIDWAAAHVPAILWTSHAGQELGTAVADALLGATNPAGRLPQTWYRADTDLPAPTDYDIIGSGWTYQYHRGEVLFPFGHGLSYTTFSYDRLTVDGLAAEHLTVTVTVTNTGDRPGDEVVQLYVTPEDWPVAAPSRRLIGFERVPLRAGESREVRFAVPATALAYWAGDGFVTPAGAYTFHVSGVRARVTLG
jgi:beta-glucosidase